MTHQSQASKAGYQHAQQRGNNTPLGDLPRGTAGPITEFLRSYERNVTPRRTLMGEIRRLLPAKWPGFKRVSATQWVRSLVHTVERPLALPAMASVSVFLCFFCVHMIAPSKTEAATAEVVRQLTDSHHYSVLNTRLICILRTPVLVNGELTGFVRHPDHQRYCDGSEPKQRSARLSAGFAALLALDVAVLEGSSQVGRETLIGINLKGLLRVAYYALKGKRVGGSNGVQSGVKNLLGIPGALSVVQKLRVVGFTMAYTAHRLIEDDARNIFVAESLPCLSGQARGQANFGAPVSGALCAYLLFGQPPEQLSHAQRLLWAASAKQQWRIVSPQAPLSAREQANTINKGIRQRAQYGATQLSRQGLLTEGSLSALTAAIGREARTLQLLLQSGTLINPDVMLNVKAPSLRRLLQDELRLLPLEPTSTQVDLVLQPKVQLALSRRVNQLFRTRSIPPDTDVMVTVTRTLDGKQRIIAGLQTRHQLYHGPFERWLPPDGSRLRAPPVRSMGSVGKAFAVYTLLENGVHSSCRAPRGIKDVDGFHGRTCIDVREQLPLRETVARSYNTSFFDALLQLDASALAPQLNLFGFSYDPSDSYRSIALGMTLGTSVLQTPEIAASGMHFLAERLNRSAPVVSQVATLTDPVKHFSPLALSPENLPDRAVLQVMGSVLNAPLSHVDGTMHLVSETVKLPPVCQFVIGKTGTSESTSYSRARDRYAIASLRCGQALWTINVMVGSPSIKKSLIANAHTHLHLVRDIAEVLSHTYPGDETL